MLIQIVFGKQRANRGENNSEKIHVNVSLGDATKSEIMKFKIGESVDYFRLTKALDDCLAEALTDSNEKHIITNVFTVISCSSRINLVLRN